MSTYIPAKANLNNNAPDMQLIKVASQFGNQFFNKYLA
jgi:hypothetical protein